MIISVIHMYTIIKNSIIFLLGGFLYGGVEIAFRGYTHWTMFIAGGLVLTVLYNLFGYIGRGHIILKCFLGCIIITTVEFLFGVGANLLLGWEVWDYSDKMFNLFGQICLLFSIGWFFISIPASLLIDGMRRLFEPAFKTHKT